MCVRIQRHAVYKFAHAFKTLFSRMSYPIGVPNNACRSLADHAAYNNAFTQQQMAASYHYSAASSSSSYHSTAPYRSTSSVGATTSCASSSGSNNNNNYSASDCSCEDCLSLNCTCAHCLCYILLCAFFAYAVVMVTLGAIGVRDDATDGGAIFGLVFGAVIVLAYIAGCCFAICKDK